MRPATHPAAAHEPTPPARRPSPARALTALSLSVLLPSLSTSIANVGLPDMAAALDAPFNEVQWVVIAYLLAVTTLVAVAGRLGDLLGRRRLLLGGITVFTIATLLCGLAPDLPLLAAARALQGAGAACMTALTMAFVGETVPEDRTGSAMGLLGAMSAAGTASGPSLGGVLIAAFDWRAIFLAGVPLGLLALTLTARALPGAPPAAGPARGRFDIAGTALLAITLGTYALAMTVEGNAFGPLAIGLLIASGAGLGLFVATENRVASPLLSPSALRDPVLAAGLTTSALVSTVMMTTLVVGPFHLARVLGLDPASVGLVMSAGPAVAALAGVPAGRAADRFGTRATTIAGLGGVLGGAAALSAMPALAGVPGYVIPLVTVTAGYALFQAANTTAVMKDVPPHRRGLASGMLNLSRNLGLVTGASVMGALFALASGTDDVATAAAADVARATRWTFAAAALLAALALAVAAGSAAAASRRARRADADSAPSRFLQS
ncbi:MFS transporter [Planomonospora sp. ID82291]|uniref:MFS transporter n=1 Tax=Planomonospora sp. ID82291 TaxID=2738136 RepID=UPI0018C4178E|nr:MFS transporter [Planomonospora sp. ID82291]MBG0816462.1 MFS transporter [Planomonospora sp. ID82291]